MDNFKVVRTGKIDIDSVRIEIHYFHIGGVEEVVATGQYNIRTNWAHVIRLEDYEDFLSSDWEDEMIEAIESRSIEIETT
tara:strand:- start:170 stop:409 length:240 start_codon:yes stop_codon:yes gene_type:complete